MLLLYIARITSVPYSIIVIILSINHIIIHTLILGISYYTINLWAMRYRNYKPDDSNVAILPVQCAVHHNIIIHFLPTIIT